MRKTASLSFDSSAVDHQQISDFFALQTAAWGARPEIASRATYGAIQLVDVVAEEFWTDGPLVVEASFDEFNLDVRVTYRGVAPALPDRRPTNEEIRTTEDGAKLLAGFMLRRNADRVRTESKDGIARVHFHFDH